MVILVNPAINSLYMPIYVKKKYYLKLLKKKKLCDVDKLIWNQKQVDVDFNRWILFQKNLFQNIR